MSAKSLSVSAIVMISCVCVRIWEAVMNLRSTLPCSGPDLLCYRFIPRATRRHGPARQSGEVGTGRRARRVLLSESRDSAKPTLDRVVDAVQTSILTSKAISAITFTSTPAPWGNKGVSCSRISKRIRTVRQMHQRGVLLRCSLTDAHMPTWHNRSPPFCSLGRRDQSLEASIHEA